MKVNKVTASGKAEVECGEDTIEVVFLTESVFQGRVFVVGHSNDKRCVSYETGRRTTSISVRKDQCGVVTTRSTNPPGLFVNVKVMISFHEEFITKVDRGYEISCFYMEADKTVTYPLTVSMQPLEPFTELAEMPRCRYEVVDPLTMEPISVVSVGSKLLHKWICDSTAPSLWCMTVHSCFVEDGSGTQFVILDDNGCAVDRYLLDNLEYGPGELQAQKEAHAFKFADKVVVNFQCSVKLDIRDGECPRPQCKDLSNKRRALKKRSNTEVVIDRGNEMDVRAQQIDVLDPQIDFGLSGDDSHLVTALRRINRVQPNCIATTTVTVGLSLCLTLIVSLVSVIVYLTKTRPSKNVD
uniref:ZP domain-containing protein n=1 Tax=Syphacia muris TaxID=451379 RepID=A0A0N5A9R2_9BILA